MIEAQSPRMQHRRGEQGIVHRGENAIEVARDRSSRHNFPSRLREHLDRPETIARLTRKASPGIRSIFHEERVWRCVAGLVSRRSESPMRLIDAHLAGVLFHEMAHQALYVKGNTRFNESFASFVEETAVRQWLTVRGTEEQQAAWEQSREVDRRLTALIGRSRSELARLYATERPAATLRGDKARVFEQLCADYRNVLHPETDNGKPDAAGCRLNNASIALRGSYHDGRCAFERLFLESGSHIPGFLDQARRIARLPRKERSAWMKQACSPVAPGEKL